METKMDKPVADMYSTGCTRTRNEKSRTMHYTKCQEFKQQIWTGSCDNSMNITVTILFHIQKQEWSLAIVPAGDGPFGKLQWSIVQSIVNSSFVEQMLTTLWRLIYPKNTHCSCSSIVSVSHSASPRRENQGLYYRDSISRIMTVCFQENGLSHKWTFCPIVHFQTAQVS